MRSLPLLLMPMIVAAPGDREPPAEDGWRVLFDGSSTDGWRNGLGEPYDGPIEDGALPVRGVAGPCLYHEDVFADFVLRCEVKQGRPGANSGIFVRLEDPINHYGRPSEHERTGFECQVGAGGTGLHSFGALYDLVPAAADVAKPAGEWNEVEIRCEGPLVRVTVNGTVTAELNADEWTEPSRRPNGSRHKFLTAIADHPRRGHIAFQDHGAPAWYRNVWIRALPGRP